MTIGLSNYEFQLNDDGVLLNGSDSGLPFVDIERVAGLDSPPFRETARDHEGMDGGFIDAEFEKAREIILEGTVYCDSDNVEPFMDDIKANYAPVTSPIPFYLKSTGVDERVIFVKSRGARFDWETMRRLGMTAIQFMLYAEDPRIYTNTLSSTTINYGGDVGTGFGFDTPIALDTFTRVSASGWGTPDTGPAWTTDLGTAAAATVDGTQGLMTHATIIDRSQLMDIAASNADATLYFKLPVTPVGGSAAAIYDLKVRWTDNSNYYFTRISTNASGSMSFVLAKAVAGVGSTLATGTSLTLNNTHLYGVRIAAFGNYITAKFWDATTTTEPAWQLTSTDATVTSSGSKLNVFSTPLSTTNLPFVFDFDNFSVRSGTGFNIDFGGGATPGGANVTNDGNRASPCILTITGPVINPVIYNNTTGDVMSFTIELTALDTLTVDTGNRTVYLNGNTNRRTTLTNPSWFFIEPGINQISFGGLSGTGSTLNVQFRSAWR
jgi:hypothetical protein